MKNLLLALIFSLFLAVPMLAQDATAESTAPAAPTEVSDVTIINEAPETPTNEAPVEPAPWQAVLLLQASLGFAALVAFVKAVRIAAEAFLSRPQQVAIAETGYGAIVPTNLKPRVRSGGKALIEEVEGMLAALKRAFDEVTDEESILVKQERQNSSSTKPLPKLEE